MTVRFNFLALIDNGLDIIFLLVLFYLSLMKNRLKRLKKNVKNLNLLTECMVVCMTLVLKQMKISSLIEMLGVLLHKKH